MTKKYCPLKYGGSSDPDAGSYCEEDSCAWWNSSWSKCNMILEGYIAGFKQAYKESRE